MFQQKEFSIRIKILRTERKISMQALANELKLDRSTVNHWELGDIGPSVDVLGKLCDFYNVSADYLMGQSDSRHKDE